MQTKTKGLIIKEQTIGESDRLVTLLTVDFGIIKAFVPRAKNYKNKNFSSTSLFVYGDFTIHKTKDAYMIDNATTIEVFFDLRNDIQKIALAQYFAQLVYHLGSQEQPGPEMLRLVLNAFHLLCKGEKDLQIVKAVVELRMICLGGYMPNILACYRCGTYESDPMYFDIQQGCIYCKECNRNNAIYAPLGVITAIRFICLSDISKIFSFSLSQENITILASITEQYLISRIETRLPTLEFYKGLF